MASDVTSIKLLLIGDSGVGKTCMLLRFCDDNFTSSFITTIGIDFKVKKLLLDGKWVKLQIWDTAGQERFRTITSAYYRGAMGILLVYDITDVNSFTNIRNWVRNIEQHAATQVNKMLVGNKADMGQQRAVSYEQGKQLADEYGFQFFETSAKDNLHISEAFAAIAKDVVVRLQREQPSSAKSAPGQRPSSAASGAAASTSGSAVGASPSIALDASASQTTKSGCCS